MSRFSMTCLVLCIACSGQGKGRNDTGDAKLSDRFAADADPSIEDTGHEGGGDIVERVGAEDMGMDWDHNELEAITDVWPDYVGDDGGFEAVAPHPEIEVHILDWTSDIHELHELLVEDVGGEAEVWTIADAMDGWEAETDAIAEVTSDSVIGDELGEVNCQPPGPWCLCTGPALEMSQGHKGGDAQDWGLSLAVLPGEAGFVIAGETQSKGEGLADAWLLAYDVHGVPLWDRTYGGVEWDTANAVAALPGGGIAFAGSTKSKGAGGSDAWMVITDNQGQPVQEKLLGGQWGESAKAIVAVEEGFWLLATASPEQDISPQVWLLKLDEDMEVSWEHLYGNGQVNQVTDLAITADGGAVIAGRRMSDGFTDWDPMLIRVDGQGNLVWETVVIMEMADEGQEVVVLPDGFALYGSTKSKNAGAWDSWLARFDLAGNLIWDKTFGGNDGDIGRAFTIAPGGDFLLVGQTYSMGSNGDAWVIRTDPNGNLLWEAAYGGEGKETPWAAAVTNDGRLVLAGASSSGLTNSDDVWLAILDLANCGI
jgi:hypothetical protein